MGAGHTTGTDVGTDGRKRRQRLAIVESAGAEERPATDPEAPPMAVSIAGVSTACSKDALASSAEAVRKTLAPE
jgi:hypothetical protein